MKPGTGSLKLNVDGARNAEQLVGGVATGVLNSNGDFVAGLSKSSAHVSSPLFAKALAARERLALVSSRDFQNIIFKSNSLQITQALRPSSIDLSLLRLTVEY